MKASCRSWASVPPTLPLTLSLFPSVIHTRTHSYTDDWRSRKWFSSCSFHWESVFHLSFICLSPVCLIPLGYLVLFHFFTLSCLWFVTILSFSIFNLSFICLSPLLHLLHLPFLLSLFFYPSFTGSTPVCVFFLHLPFIYSLRVYPIRPSCLIFLLPSST